MLKAESFISQFTTSWAKHHRGPNHFSHLLCSFHKTHQLSDYWFSVLNDLIGAHSLISCCERQHKHERKTKDKYCCFFGAWAGIGLMVGVHCQFVFCCFKPWQVTVTKFEQNWWNFATFWSENVVITVAASLAHPDTLPPVSISTPHISVCQRSRQVKQQMARDVPQPEGSWHWVCLDKQQPTGSCWEGLRVWHRGVMSARSHCSVLILHNTTDFRLRLLVSRSIQLKGFVWPKSFLAQECAWGWI